MTDHPVPPANQRRLRGIPRLISSNRFDFLDFTPGFQISVSALHQDCVQWRRKPANRNSVKSASSSLPPSAICGRNASNSSSTSSPNSICPWKGTGEPPGTPFRRPGRAESCQTRGAAGASRRANPDDPSVVNGLSRQVAQMGKSAGPSPLASGQPSCDESW